MLDLLNFGSKKRTPLRSISLLLVLMALVLWATATLTRQSACKALETRAGDALSVYTGSLGRELEKFRALPQILSRKLVLMNLLLQPDNGDRISVANQELVELNRISKSLATYLLDNRGQVIASSNWNQSDSFVGEDLSFRPYFTDAIRFGHDAYFAIGTTSGKRGYYFSSAIDIEGERAGVVVIKVDLSMLENNWRAGSDEVIVTDRDGVIFLSSREEWLYRGLYPLSDETRLRILDSRRYADNSIELLDITSREELSTSRQLVTLRNSTDGTQRELLQLSRTMPTDAWSVHIWTDVSPIHDLVRSAMIQAGLFMLLLAAIYKLLQIRAQARDQKARLEKEAFDKLESLVQQRTTELTAEIKERKQTELELQETQSKLVQTAKMAALGQMATSITHELNQPLGAIRNFSDNAQTLLKRDQLASVDSNLKLISRMTERMNDIMQHLKSFARKTPLALEPVSIHQVLSETLLVLGPTIKRADVTINYLRADESLLIVAEPNRLQQVFTNLLQNAIDAMKQSDQRIITLSTMRNKENESVTVVVTDTGSGISELSQEKLFEPFYSTKSDGDGLGLGLSISYGIMRDMGGDISVSSSPGGGACFMLVLKEAKQMETTAA